MSESPMPQDWFKTTEDKWVDKLCQLIALEEDFSLDSLVSVYQEVGRSVDTLLEVIRYAKEQQISIEDAMVDYCRPKIELRPKARSKMKTHFNVKISKEH